jgi:hypothetical protein
VTRPSAGLLCVYAITGARRRVPARGPGGERLDSVAAGRFAAIVTRAPDAARSSLPRLRRHDAVVRHLWSRLPAVLPARFGTCFGGAAELRLALASRERALARDLGRVRGRAQMTVRVFAVPAPAVPQLTASTGLSAGAEYLRGRAAQAAREREVPGFEPLRSSVSRWVREERVEKHAGVISVYHLVPRSSVDAYRRVLQRAAAGAELRIAVTGPHPPYAFC